MFCVGVGETRFPSNRSRTLWTSSPAVLPAPLRGDRADQPQLAGLRQGRARRLPRRHQGARRRGGAAAGLRRLHPRRAPPRRDVVRLGPARDTVRAVAYQQRRARPARGVGRAGRGVAGEAGRAGRPTPTTTSTRPARGRCPARARRRGAGWRRPSWCAPSDRDGAPTRASTWSSRPGSPSGTTTSASCSPRPGPTAPTVGRPSPLPSQPVRHLRGPAARRPRRRSPASSPGRCRARRRAAARFGTGFHAWVEARFGQQALIEPDELPGPRRRRHRRRGRPGRLVTQLRGRPVRRPRPARRRGAVRAGARRPGRPRPHRRGLRRATTAASSSSTGRRPPRDGRPAPARALPARLGRAAPASRSSRCGPRSTTSAPAAPSSPPTCRDRAEASRALVVRPAREPPDGSMATTRAASAERARSRPSAPKVCSRSCDVVSSPVTMWSETVQIAQRPAAVLRGERVERAGLHLDREHAVLDHRAPSARAGAGRTSRCEKISPTWRATSRIARRGVVRPAEQPEVGDGRVVEPLERGSGSSMSRCRRREAMTMSRIADLLGQRAAGADADDRLRRRTPGTAR